MPMCVPESKLIIMSDKDVKIEALEKRVDELERRLKEIEERLK